MYFKVRSCLNQKRAKKAVIGVHIRYPSPVCGRHSDDVTGIEDEHTSCRNRELVSSQRHRWVDHGDDFVVDEDRNPHRFPSVPAPVNLFIDVVASRDGHSQFSVLVFHTASEVTVGGLESPVFDHCKMDNI